MQLLAATVSKAPREVSTKFGPRRVCDVVLPDGTETAIWGPVNYAPLEYLQQGDAVTVSRDSKNKISIVENHLTHPGMVAPTLPQQTQPVTPPPTQSPQTGSMTPETKKAIAAFVGEMGDLYRYCYETAGEKLATAPNEAKQDMASSLFIAAQKRFNLC